MPKATPDAVLDTMLDELENTVDMLYVCTDEPANYAAIAALTLASVALDSGDFAIGDGDSSGRKTTVSQQTGISITASGDADHIVLADAANTTLKYVTTCTSQTLTSGGTVTVPAWDIEIADPT